MPISDPYSEEVTMALRAVRNAFVTGIAGLLLAAGHCYGDGVGEGADWTADEAIKLLKEGNERFVSGTMTWPEQSKKRRKAIGQRQKPFAVVVSCSDSRVPPEVVFDRGLGDLFVVRTAGEVVKEVELGSIEYAVEHLHAPLVVVLGHKRCGAVEAAVKGGEVPGNIAALVNLIKPAVEEARKQKGDLTDNAVRANTKVVADSIGGSAIITHLMKEKRARIVRAYYDLDDGTVTILEEGK